MPLVCMEESFWQLHFEGNWWRIGSEKFRVAANCLVNASGIEKKNAGDWIKGFLTT